MKHVKTIAAVLLVLFSAGAARAAFSDCHDATCRITADDGGCGTGCAFRREGGKVYVLTNAHVATGETVQVEFWRFGHKSQALPGRVVLRNETVDAAVVTVDEERFAGVLPKVMSLAAREQSPPAEQTVLSVGCAGGNWSTGWKGHVLGYNGGDMYFRSPPANGRSGSAIFNADGTAIVGLLKARTSDDTTGIATDLPSLHLALAVLEPWQQTQCPGGQCPTPWRLSPYRYQQDQRIGQLEIQRQQVWPTLPAAPSTANDLGPTNQRLDRIAELLLDMREEPPQPTPPEATAELKQATGKIGEIANGLLGDRETLLKRFDERLERVKAELDNDADRADVARAYVKDLAAEKLSDGTLGISGGKLLAGALGLSGPLSAAIGVGLWLLSRRAGSRLETGNPLLVERMFERISDRVDAIGNQLKK